MELHQKIRVERDELVRICEQLGTGRGKTWPKLRRDIEQIVADLYGNSETLNWLMPTSNRVAGWKKAKEDTIRIEVGVLKALLELSDSPDISVDRVLTISAPNRGLAYLECRIIRSNQEGWMAILDEFSFHIDSILAEDNAGREIGRIYYSSIRATLELRTESLKVSDTMIEANGSEAIRRTHQDAETNLEVSLQSEKKLQWKISHSDRGPLKGHVRHLNLCSFDEGEPQVQDCAVLLCNSVDLEPEFRPIVGTELPDPGRNNLRNQIVKNLRQKGLSYEFAVSSLLGNNNAV